MSADGFPRNFRPHEFACRCGMGCDAPSMDRVRHLAWSLQAIRDAIGSPIHIASSYRCPVHNAEVGGALFSQHLQGWAADLHTGVTPEELAAELLQLIRAGRIPQGGVGLYDWGVHYDLRGTQARWDERTPKEEPKNG